MFQVQILGSSAAIPTNTRLPSAQVVSYRDRHYLVDCGEGAQMQLNRWRVRSSRLDAIFISHLHGDHVFGLPGLLTSLGLHGRTEALKLFGPAGLRVMLSVVFEQTQSYLPFELEFFPLEEYASGTVIFSTGELKVQVLPLKHRIFCRGFRFTEVNKKPHFDFYKAKALEVPNVYFGLLKQGNTIQLPDGRKILPEMVLNPPDAPLSYAYCSDTAFYETLSPWLKDCTLLYHEATFSESARARAKETGHSTAADAARQALQSGVKHLLLGHFSARYKELDELLAEAQAVFPAVSLSREGDIFKVADYAAGPALG